MANQNDSSSLIDRFRDPQKVRDLASHIRREAAGPVTFMEVCGTHTMAVHQFGLRQLIPPEIKLLSGPGCPVCVTPALYCEKARRLAADPNVTVCTFGDLVRVPGPNGSLEDVRAEGGDVRIVYSPQQALETAIANPERRVVFLAVGFETTAPLTAAVLRQAKNRNVDNFFILSGHKVMPPPMRTLVEAGEVHIDGFLCPGHVSVVIGAEPYSFLSEEKGKPCVIAGFEPVDILQAILMLLHQCSEGRSAVEIQYTRAVRPEGNRRATGIMQQVFQPRDDTWRGLGVIAASGLELRQEFEGFDAEQLIGQMEPIEEMETGCICGDILRGAAVPTECSLFGTICTPQRPRGACMVSREGTCATYYRFRDQP